MIILGGEPPPPAPDAVLAWADACVAQFFGDLADYLPFVQPDDEEEQT